MTVQCDHCFTRERIYILCEHHKETSSVLKVGHTLPEEVTLGLHEKDDEQLARHRKGKGILLNIWDIIPARDLSCQAPAVQGLFTFLQQFHTHPFSSPTLSDQGYGGRQTSPSSLLSLATETGDYAEKSQRM